MQKNYNENLVAGAAIRDDKGRRISKLFEASHPKMTVGYAKNLIMPNDPTEQEFNFRQSGGGVIEDGVAVIDKVKGNSVVWNQLIKDFREPSNWLTNGNDATIVGDKIHIKFASASSLNAFGVKSSKFSAGHKYCLLMNNENAVPLTALKLGSAFSVGDMGSTIGSKTPAITGAIPTSSADNGAFWFWPSDDTKLEGDFSNIYITDLTQMFGAGNEPTTYEEFLSRKPKVEDEFAYNEGTIVSNKVEKVVTTGRNLFDSSTAIDGKTIIDETGVEVINSLGWCSTFIPIIGGESYFCKGVTINIQGYGVHCYDKDKQHINGVGIPQVGKTFDAPINAKYIRIHGLYDSSPANAAILNLSDASFNGQYAPYEKHELDLSWIKEIKDAEGVKLFEDGMRSAGTAFDEVGKNRAVKNIGSHTFDGAETITIEMSGLFNVSLSGIKRPATTNDVVGILMSGDFEVVRTQSEWGTLTKGISPNANIANAIFVFIKDETSVANVRSAILGKTILFELADPIEVEYDEKNLTYPVIAGGTEEAIASEPSTAFRADIGYGIDAVKTILDLKARVEALEGK